MSILGLKRLVFEHFPVKSYLNPFIYRDIKVKLEVEHLIVDSPMLEWLEPPC